MPLSFPVPRTLQILCIGILISALAGPVIAYELTTDTGTIANGDPVTLRGIATGHPREGLQVWVIGKNYLDISTIPVNNDNSFEFELKPSETLNLASGQYFVVVQHPMMNGEFDIYYDAASGKVINRQMGADGNTIYTMSGAGSLQGPASANALVSAISSQNVDDTFTTYTFFISPPSALIYPIGDHAVGDRFTISGSTNLAAGDQLMVEITSSSFQPTRKTADGGFSGSAGTATVVPGQGGNNRWSFDVDASEFKPDEYIVTVKGITVDVTGSTVFMIREQSPAPLITQEITPFATTVIATTIPVPLTTTPAKSPVPAGLAILGLAVAVMRKVRR
ncbi:MAG: hypothetical protein CVV32_10695 [Methanomicrobiales archaeon HGW-Methanomicrobiales-3]|jgi:hypothetical protein|nr:MAG: hypothetical protein CVV32_10695 [Methanomicrobiales archaeon HGW-Methanomicrobiales-3]